MIAIYVVGIFLAIVLAAVLFFLYSPKDRTPLLGGICAVLALAVIGLAFGTYPVAQNLAQASAIGGYVQTLNGSVVAANVEVTHCTKEKEEYGGSNCKHTTRCDSYIVLETEYYTETYTDSKGNPQTRQVPRQVPVTKWYDCPYMSVEYTYTLQAQAYHTFTFTIADHIFGAESRQLRGFVPAVPNTVPAEWQRAKDALNAGTTVPVTVPDTYDNYILGSDQQDAKDYSGDVQKFKDLGLLPNHTTQLSDPVTSQFRADKVEYVGFTPQNPASWQDALMKFNAAFGTMKQGDLHIVMLKASALPPGTVPEDYMRVLKTYWQSYLGKNAFPKNAVALALAVDDSGQKVEWARATTGMPLGNNEMTTKLMLDLEDQPLTVDGIFGSTTGAVVKNKDKYDVKYTLGNGILPQTMIADPVFAFKRSCMKCSDSNETDQSGYVGLKDLIPISGWGIFGAITADIFIGALLTALDALLYNQLTGSVPTVMSTSSNFGYCSHVRSRSFTRL